MINYKSNTRGNTTSKNKPQAFLFAAPEDQTEQKQLVELTLSHEFGANLCVWTGDALPEDGELDKLKEISLLILAVTERLAGTLAKTAAQAVRFCYENRIPVLPVYYISPNSRTEPAGSFYRAVSAALGGEKEMAELDGPRFAAKDFKTQFSRKLRALVISDEIIEEILSSAFQKQIFLSYRKKDREQALKVMKAIHDVPQCENLAIWFDDFLPAGRDFNDEINKELLGSDAFVLTVTNNLTERDSSGRHNYVQREEWPRAVNSKAEEKRILVEAENTDHGELAKEMNPPIRKTLPVWDSEALRSAIERASLLDDSGRELDVRQKFLLGVAYLTATRVEKDPQRALRLLGEAAGAGYAEACEQLGKIYLNGIGVERDRERGIRYYRKAYDLLMKEEATKENLRHINRLFYQLDGLTFLLKTDNRVNEANTITKSFLERVENSPYRDEDEFILFRVNALTDLANLFYEFDLDTEGSGSGGPSFERLNQAKQYADRARELIGKYQGEDTDMADFLRVVITDQYADLSKYRGNLKDAILWKEQSKEKIEPLAEKTGDMEHLNRSFQISNNLGLFYRELALKPEQSSGKELLLKKADAHMEDAISRARQLAELDPDYGQFLSLALSNRIFITEDETEKKAYARECYEAFLNFLKYRNIDEREAWELLNISDDFKVRIDNIHEFTSRKERKEIFKKVYGKAPEFHASSLIPFFAIALIALVILLPAFFGIRQLVRKHNAMKDDNVVYTISHGTGNVKVVYGEMDVVVLRDSYKERPVTEIGTKALFNYSAAKEVVLPAQLEKIGAGAFTGCSGLTELRLPESVREIKRAAFAGCVGLTEFELPDGITEIPKFAFYGCEGLRRVTIPPSVTKIANNAFLGCSKDLVIIGEPGSMAQTFAEKHFSFEPLAGTEESANAA